MKQFFCVAAFVSFVALSCNDSSPKTDEDVYAEGSFGYDLRFLQQYDSVVVLQSEPEAAQVIVSPRYQGKVFTSTAAGMKGASFGWINYGAFSGPPDAHMNAYGGENRFWLGPEGGPFSLFFRPGKEMVFDNWKTPSPIDTEAWTVKAKNNSAVHLQKQMALVNFAGTQLQLQVDRSISIFSNNALQTVLQEPLDTSVKAVGYKTSNVLTNAGTEAWTEKTGAPCIWILDMFKPSPNTTIVLPYQQEGNGKIATTDYFGEIPAERISIRSGILLFKADGKSRGKLGLSPQRARPVAGSYDADAGLLTLTFFDVEPNARYLNQEWTTTKPAFSGDAVNAYNDGPLEDGSQMGPFYEIESVSPAAFLAPGASLTHEHVVVHLTGNRNALDRLARKHLGISLDEIRLAFN